MKTQAQNKLVFKKKGIVELNDSQLINIGGGTSREYVTKPTTDDPNGSSKICPTITSFISVIN